jgi:hypothetical protein
MRAVMLETIDLVDYFFEGLRLRDAMRAVMLETKRTKILEEYANNFVGSPSHGEPWQIVEQREDGWRVLRRLTYDSRVELWVDWRGNRVFHVVIAEGILVDTQFVPVQMPRWAWAVVNACVSHEPLGTPEPK